LGLSESRNRGIRVAERDIIAFFDDDAIADKNWVKELVKIYEEKDAIAVGGKMMDFEKAKISSRGFKVVLVGLFIFWLISTKKNYKGVLLPTLSCEYICYSFNIHKR